MEAVSPSATSAVAAVKRIRGVADRSSMRTVAIVLPSASTPNGKASTSSERTIVSASSTDVVVHNGDGEGRGR